MKVWNWQFLNTVITGKNAIKISIDRILILFAMIGALF